MIRTLSFLAAFFIFFQTANAQTQAELDAILHGKGLAELNCAKCHSVQLTGDSPNKDAPPFRTFSTYRSITLIGWELMNEDWGEHRKMPRFQIAADQVRDILEWIRWLQPEEQGQRLVRENCSRCHAIGLEDESNHPGAIPFRNISIFYPVEALENAFAEGIETGHPDMPVFDASIDQIRSIIAYIKTVQEPKAE